MLRRMKRAPTVRAALLTGAVLALVASFGLHPEPLDADRVGAHRGLASAHTDEARHACPACLTHGAALATRPAELPSASLAEAPSYCRTAPRFVGRLAGRDLAGRSPPARA